MFPELSPSRGGRLFALCVAAALGIGAEPVPEDVFRLRPDVGFALVEAAITGHDGPVTHHVYDALAADMDLDGDLDFFVNRHVRHAPELYRSSGGVFEHVDAARSGIEAIPGFPDFFVESRRMVELLSRPETPPGLYLWHDSDREFLWRLYLKSGFEAPLPVTVALRANSAVARVFWLELRPGERIGGRSLVLTLDQRRVNRSLGIRLEQPTSRLEVEVLGDGPGRPEIFVGGCLTPVAGDAVTLWRPDPHGVAWAQAEGSPEPELFFTRGALQGTLAPPEAPKSGQLYRWQGGETLYRLAEPGVVPPDYGRGRRAEWVDVDNDGRNELYVGNQGTPNALLTRDPASGRYRDRAAELGLDLRCGESFVWHDWDGDGFQDLFYVCGRALGVARNLGGARFERLVPERLGLALDAGGSGASPRGFRLLDFDRDGRLDLWVGHYSKEAHDRLFLRRGDGFVEITRQAGLAKIRGLRARLVFDGDGDGNVDVLGLGDELLLLRNVGGERVEPRVLSETGRRIQVATVADVDGDGRLDLLLVGRQRHLVLNRSGQRSLAVHLGFSENAPIGALVRVHDDGGGVQVQRYGSAASSDASQALSPLHFGIPERASLRRLSVRWPGSTSETSYPVPPGARALHLRR